MNGGGLRAVTLAAVVALAVLVVAAVVVLAFRSRDYADVAPFIAVIVAVLAPTITSLVGFFTARQTQAVMADVQQRVNGHLDDHVQLTKGQQEIATKLADKLPDQSTGGERTDGHE